MSQTIDHKIVEMKFDNKQFENNAATTMSTLQKLKSSLNFSKVGESFDSITKAADKVDLDGVDKAISGVESKFSALEVVAITALSNITNSFLNHAKSWVSAFTVEPIISGFQEYETQMNAVQTILANTQKEGTTVKDVNAALDELNYYADKTIYNFTEMTRNIGTFTAAGVDLKTSVSAIQGIANLAAVSGSTSQQASTAMYQLSQALAAGTVKLMDWNSVVNAGMGGQIFQDALRETSDLLGTGASAAIEAEGSFRESLKAGWLTSEVLTETLKKFTTSGAAEYVANYTGLTKEAVESELELARSTYGEADAIEKASEALAKKSGKNKDEIMQTLKFAQTAEDAATKVKTFTQLIDTLKEAVQSGWSASFRIIIGDFEEAKELFTEISDSFGAVIGASADARNKLLAEAFNKVDPNEYLASIVDVPKEAVDNLEIVAKEAGVTSDLFKKTLDEFTQGDEVLNSSMTHMMDLIVSGKEATTYIADMTGMTEESVKKLQDLGKEFGYASEEFNEFADTLAKGDPEIKESIINLIKLNDVITKPSGRELLIDSLRNALKGLVSVIKPVQEAFREVFPPATADQVYGMLESFHEFSKSLILNEKNSANLKKTFKGLFDIVKLLGDGFKFLLKLILPVNKPIGSLAEGVLALTGGLGELLSIFANGVRSSVALNKAFELLQKGSSALMTGLSYLIRTGVHFVERFSKLEGVSKFIDSITNAFKRLKEKGSPYVEDFLREADLFLSSLFNLEDINLDSVLQEISRAFEDLATKIDNFSLSDIGDMVDRFKEKIDQLKQTVMGNEGFATFVTNFKKYGEELKNSFTLDNLLDRLEKVMDVFGKFFNWVRNTFGPAFEDFNVGTVAAGAGGFGIIYALIKLAKSFENITDVFSGIPEVLGSVKGALDAYQNDLKAEALIKVAGGIAILAGALVLLSFADQENLLSAAVALTMISGVLLIGVTKLLEASNKGKEMSVALNTFAKGFSSAVKSLGRSMVIKAIGSTVKKFAESIAIIAASIIAIGVLYTKNPTGFNAAIKTIAAIAGVLAAIGLLMATGSKFLTKKDATKIKAMGTSILMISASLSLIVSAIAKLMKMEIPSDYETKFMILGGIIAGLAGLALVLGLTARIAGNNQLPKMASTIKSLAILLAATVLSLKVLFDMEIPEDYKVKLGILAGIFAAFGVMLIAMAGAAKLSGGNSFKAAGTILSMTVFVAAIVAALYVLTLIPGDKMLKGALALGGILLALGGALYGAGKIADKDTYKSVIAMAINVGVITAALAVLAMIPAAKLLKASVALGAALMTLALNFKEVGKVKSKQALPSILAMVAAATAIAYALYVLSEQPWQGLLAAAAAMSLTLIAFSKSFESILGKRWSDNNVKKIGTFLLMTLAVIPIGYALAELSKQPWQGVLAAAAGLSAVLLAMSLGFSIISAAKPNLTAIATFLTGSLGVIGIALGLSVLASQPLDGILAAAIAVGLIIAEVSILMLACVVAGSAAPAALAGIGVMAAVIAGLTAIVAALGALMHVEGFQDLMNGGIQVMTMLGEAIGGFIGGIISSAISQVSSVLPQIGLDLSQFMDNLRPFIIGSKMLDAESVACVGFLAAIILALTAAEIVTGITRLFGLSLVDMAIELSEFMVALMPFIVSSRQLSEDSMKACGYLAEMILKLTAANVLNGIAGFFGLTGKLSDFGEELVAFGPSIKEFAEQVKDVKPESVQGAASAAEIMAQVASKLQGHGGFIQDILGDKSLKTFADELVAFGPSIKQFAEDVIDVKPEAVQGAASAAEIMAQVAEKLPNQGGLAAKILGDNTLSEFGAELVAFGPLIMEFASIVSGISPMSVVGVASATTIMSNLATDLPDTDTLWNKIFGGGQVTLSEFGAELVAFGISMTEFANSVSGINVIQISGAIASFKELLDLANLASGTSADSLVNFSYGLEMMGVEGVNNFVAAFNDAGPLVTTAIQTMYTSIFTVMTVQNATFFIKGTDAATQYIQGFRNTYPTAFLVGSEITQQVLNAMQLLIAMFLLKGLTSATNYLQGFKNKYQEARSTGTTLANNALSGCQAITSSFYSAGAAAGQGFVNGIKSKLSDASAAGKEIAKAAYEAAKKELEIHSPSRKMGWLGDMGGVGFVMSLLSHATEAYEAGEEVAKSSMSGMERFLVHDDINDPVIRPTVDLSDVTSSFQKVQEMFNSAIRGTSSLADSVSFKMVERRNENQVKDNSNGERNGNTYNMVQNNYSPKALSRIEIYRQTRNQMMLLKGVTK